MSKTKSSSVRMREAGFKPMQLWLTTEQHRKLFQAAHFEELKATQFLLHHGLAAAKRIILRNSRNAY